jgi:hypothetical protein
VQGTISPSTTHSHCATPAITREAAIQRLNIADPAEPELDMSKVEPVDPETVKTVEAVGEQFFSCLAEGKTMSAMNLMSGDYLQQWLFLQIRSLPGGPSESSIDILFDRFAQEQAETEARGGFDYTTGYLDYFFGGVSNQKPSGPVQTANGKIHIGFTFTTVYFPGNVPDSPSHTQPRDIVFVREGNGWRIDGMKHGSDAWFDEPF